MHSSAKRSAPKALFLDMDETLCDTTKANIIAQETTALRLKQKFGSQVDAPRFVSSFLKGIYKEWNREQREKYAPYRQEHGELVYRQKLVDDLLNEQNLYVDASFCEELHLLFEQDRMAAFDFFPGIKDFLIEIREHLTLIVITNGPEFSQIPKIESVTMHDYVDNIIIGGQEPEQKPAKSIFEKAMRLANCQAHDAIHFGDSLETDIDGANRAGIPSVWIKHGQQATEEFTPTYSLNTPMDIPAFTHDLIGLAKPGVQKR